MKFAVSFLFTLFSTVCFGNSIYKYSDLSVFGDYYLTQSHFFGFSDKYQEEIRSKMAPLSPAFSVSPTYLEIKDLIRTHNVKSVSELLEYLPLPYKFNYTLVYDSRSTHAQDVTFQKPRVILFGGDAKLLIAFNGDEEKESSNRVEIIEYLEKQKDFRFREIIFGGNKKADFNDKPETCIKCHRERPIWDSYAFWPGVYGSADDSMNESAFNTVTNQERAEFQKWLSTKNDSPIYSKLVTVEPIQGLKRQDDGTTAEVVVEDFPFFPYWQNLTYDYKIPPNYRRTNMVGLPINFNKFAVGYHMRPNLRLTERLFNLNAIRIAEKIRTNPAYAKFPNLIEFLSGWKDCRNMKVKGFSEAWKAFVDSRTQRLKSRHFIVSAQVSSGEYENYKSNLDGSGSSVDVTVKSHILAALTGIPFDQFSLSLEVDQSSFFTGDMPFVTLLSRKLNPEGVVFGKSNCKKVEAELPDAIGQLGYNPFEEINFTTERPEPSSVNPFSSCIVCHAAQPIVGPRIPFHDLDYMKKHVLNFKFNGVTVREKIKNRIDATDNRRMPPTHSLSLQEKQAIHNFLNDIP